MSLAYSVISPEFSSLIEFTAAYLCPNVQKKHSQSHRTPNENKEPEAKQCSCYVYFWAQKSFLCVYPLHCFYCHSTCQLGYKWNKGWVHQEPLPVASNMGIKQDSLTNRAPLLCLWQPVGDNAHPFSWWDYCYQMVFEPPAITLFTD